MPTVKRRRQADTTGSFPPLHDIRVIVMAVVCGAIVMAILFWLA
ncbi:hypothetical protein [Nitratireductor mangrovi]|nr:hypothetical protein [Nitratireductor mangrovi]